MIPQLPEPNTLSSRRLSQRSSNKRSFCNTNRLPPATVKLQLPTQSPYILVQNSTALRLVLFCVLACPQPSRRTHHHHYVSDPGPSRREATGQLALTALSRMGLSKGRASTACPTSEIDTIMMFCRNTRDNFRLERRRVSLNGTFTRYYHTFS